MWCSTLPRRRPRRRISALLPLAFPSRVNRPCKVVSPMVTTAFLLFAILNRLIIHGALPLSLSSQIMISCEVARTLFVVWMWIQPIKLSATYSLFCKIYVLLFTNFVDNILLVSAQICTFKHQYMFGCIVLSQCRMQIVPKYEYILHLHRV